MESRAGWKHRQGKQEVIFVAKAHFVKCMNEFEQHVTAVSAISTFPVKGRTVSFIQV